MGKKEREGSKILVRCAWCGKDMGEKPGGTKIEYTHGICDECVERVLKEEVDPVQEELFPNARRYPDST